MAYNIYYTELSSYNETYKDWILSYKSRFSSCSYFNLSIWVPTNIKGNFCSGSKLQ